MKKILSINESKNFFLNFFNIGKNSNIFIANNDNEINNISNNDNQINNISKNDNQINNTSINDNQINNTSINNNNKSRYPAHGRLDENEIVKKHLNRPILQDYPFTCYGKTKTNNRSFQKSRYNSFDFFEYSTINDLMYCFYCRNLSNKKGIGYEPAFVEGTKNWKEGLRNLSNHLNTKMHKDSLLKFGDLSNNLQNKKTINDLMEILEVSGDKQKQQRIEEKQILYQDAV